MRSDSLILTSLLPSSLAACLSPSSSTSAASNSWMRIANENRIVTFMTLTSFAILSLLPAIAIRRHGNRPELVEGTGHPFVGQHVFKGRHHYPIVAFD